MQINKIIFAILLFFICVNIAVVSANDFNSTDNMESDNGDVELDEEISTLNAEIDNNSECDVEKVASTITIGSDSGGDVEKVASTIPVSSDEKGNVEKTTPAITVSSNHVKSKDTLEIHLKNSAGSPIKAKKFTAVLNNVKYSLKTDSKGFSKINIDLPADSYKLKVIVDEDDNFNKVTKYFTIKVSKIPTKIIQSGNFVQKNDYLYFWLTDSNGYPLSGKKVSIKFKGKTYTRKTNSKGQVSIKIKSSKYKNFIKIKFKGDKRFGFSSMKLKFYVLKEPLSINIGNSKFLTKGFLRFYLKNSDYMLSKKKVTIEVGGKKFKLRTNSEGIIVIKPNLKSGFYSVKAKYTKYYSIKYLKCIRGNVKNPFKESIPLKNGKPNIDFMPKDFVWGDGHAQYTLKKSQYREVLKMDSYCLFLNGKLTKYTFFKTKSQPKLNHIVKREKWNVIEREIYTKLVKANAHNYWPAKITVSLKGKSYKYPWVSDPQDDGHTCGPTSCSMCSQVLKNYVCEGYIAKLAKTDNYGTSCNNMIAAMKKNNFDATYYYKSSFGKALKEVYKGGATLIFHAYNHYVSILDISKNGKKVLVSNSYGSYDDISTGWVKVSYMKNKFSDIDESLIVKLNYKLSDSTKNKINHYYSNMGTKWVAKDTHQSIGEI